MSVITLRIDDRDVAIASGGSLLQAARQVGIALPTLCHLDGLSAIGACRLCRPRQVIMLISMRQSS